MNLEKYSERLQGFLQTAQNKALSSDHQQFMPEHFLKVLLEDSQGLATSLIQKAGGDLSLIQKRSKKRSMLCQSARRKWAALSLAAVGKSLHSSRRSRT